MKNYLIINTPIYGDFLSMAALMLKHEAPQTPVTLLRYNCGYYDARTGRFSPVPQP